MIYFKILTQLIPVIASIFRLIASRKLLKQEQIDKLNSSIQTVMGEIHDPEILGQDAINQYQELNDLPESES